jgi:hypothetical protein
MLNRITKGALLCAVLPIGLAVSACSGVGEAGMHHVVAGNWPAAKEDFAKDYQNDPTHPVAVFNMGATYHHDGDIDKADSMFHEAVERGKTHIPDDTLEPAGSGVTVADYACSRLHRDNKLDAGCGDRIVAEAPPAPPPAPVAEAAPPPAAVAQAAPEPAPVEAEATAVPPKQDRH